MLCAANLYTYTPGQRAVNIVELEISLTHTRESHRCLKARKLALYQIYLSTQEML